MTWEPKEIVVSLPVPPEGYDPVEFARFMQEGWRINAERQVIIDLAARENRPLTQEEQLHFDELADEVSTRLAALEKTRAQAH